MDEQYIGIAFFAHLERFTGSDGYGLYDIACLLFEHGNENIQQARVLRGCCGCKDNVRVGGCDNGSFGWGRGRGFGGRGFSSGWSFGSRSNCWGGSSAGG